jgi:hypothetical protein
MWTLLPMLLLWPGLSCLYAALWLVLWPGLCGNSMCAYAYFYDASMGHNTWYLVPGNKRSRYHCHHATQDSRQSLAHPATTLATAGPGPPFHSQRQALFQSLAA